MSSEKIYKKIDESLENLDEVHNYFTRQCEFLESDYIENSIKNHIRQDKVHLKQHSAKDMIRHQEEYINMIKGLFESYKRKIRLYDRLIKLNTLQKNQKTPEDNIEMMKDSNSDLKNEMKSVFK